MLTPDELRAEYADAEIDLDEALAAGDVAAARAANMRARRAFNDLAPRFGLAIVRSPR